MKKKRNYSLTSKERKELQSEKSAVKPAKKGAAKDDEVIDKEELQFGEEGVRVESESAAVADTLKFRKKNILIACMAVVLASVLIFLAIYLPAKLERGRFSSVNNPVAVVYLDNGMELEFELFEDTVPYATANFIYLAVNNFFDGTIVFDLDNTHGWVRMGGYTAKDKHNAIYADNKKYIDSLKGFPEDDDDAAKPTTFKESEVKLLYTITRETKQNSIANQKGVLITRFFRNSFTEFAVASQANAQLKPSTPSTMSDPVVFGKALNPTTENLVETISKLTTEPSQVTNIPWNFPTSTLKIKDIKIYNIDYNAWRAFKFKESMDELGANPTWSTGSTGTARKYY